MLPDAWLNDNDGDDDGLAEFSDDGVVRNGS